MCIRDSIYTATNPVSGLSSKLPAAFLVFVGVLLLTFLVLRYTMFGRGIYAIGGNESAAYNAGFAVRRTKFLLYLFAGVIASVAGIIRVCMMQQCHPTNMLGMEMNIVAGVDVYKRQVQKYILKLQLYSRKCKKRLTLGKESLIIWLSIKTFSLKWEQSWPLRTQNRLSLIHILNNGWEHIRINEAGFDDEGTSIETQQGDQVLAVDAEYGICLLYTSSTSCMRCCGIWRRKKRHG